MLFTIAYLLILTLGLTLALMPLAIRLGLRWNVVDRPGPRKIHTRLMPLSGGWAIMLALSIVLWGHLIVALAIRNSTLAAHIPKELTIFVVNAPVLIGKVSGLYLGAVGVFVLGLLDDVIGMSVKSRLVFQTLIAGFLVSVGLHPQLTFIPTWVSCLIGVIWIVGITNSFNFLDGLDGLAAGTALISTIGLMAIMAIGKQPDVAFLLAVFAGLLLGFLFFNSHPASVFLGSSGSLLIGYLMAVSAMLTTYTVKAETNWLVPTLVPLLILAIPIYDTTSVVLIRLLKKRSVAIGDQSHFHHRLLKVGFSHRQAVVFIWTISFAIGISAVQLIGSSLLMSLLILLQIVAIFMVMVVAERVANLARLKLLAQLTPPQPRISNTIEAAGQYSRGGTSSSLLKVD